MSHSNSTHPTEPPPGGPALPLLPAGPLTAFADALERGGDLAGLPGDLAAVAEAAREVAVFSREHVTGAGGDRLDAALWRHTDSRPRPVVVLPAPWTDLGRLAYAVQGALLAARGYDVLAYSPRGFGASEGLADFAGPLDVTDARQALDHLTGRAAGPVTGAGFLGFSYGAGIAQLAAAHDARVGAVAALAGWSDLDAVFYENRTRRTAAARTFLTGAVRARLSARTERALENVLTGRDPAATRRWAERRSALTHLKEFDRHRVAVFLAQSWRDPLFPVNQTLRFFEELTGPKRLDLTADRPPLDGTPGLLGRPERPWTDAHRWFDHHLRGVDNGIDAEGGVVGEVSGTGRLEHRPGWPTFTGPLHRLYLTGSGELAAGPDPGWSAPVLCGVDAPHPATADLATPPAHRRRPDPRPGTGPAGATWVSAPLTRTARLRGAPRLRVTYRAANPGSSFVARLLDLAPDGSTRPLTQAPYSDLDSPPDSLVVADLTLQAVAHDIPRGHRLLLVLATRDPFHADANLPRATLAFTSPEPTPSCLDLPVDPWSTD
ncbi:alpha/beta fold hydrolase [Streptomyces sp. RerS4]|uniref:alpha/beta fold hydrolase n=1 Tax=Streptomyces sp. RerS4 TaxID=2942449 RepID=UPI00201CA19D|nr:alpha/beta fold hydrolase [Streptomyces sp. RerS4]UQX02322.1 alpha/beta fold hydrolase [Streptomyces sp. RerS4]